MIWKCTGLRVQDQKGPFQGCQCWMEEASSTDYCSGSLNASISSMGFVWGTCWLNSNLVITLCFRAPASLSKALTEGWGSEGGLYSLSLSLRLRDAFRPQQGPWEIVRNSCLLRCAESSPLWRASQWLVLHLDTATGLASRSHSQVTNTS